VSGRSNIATGKTVMAKTAWTNNAKQAVNNRPSLKEATVTTPAKNGNPHI